MRNFAVVFALRDGTGKKELTHRQPGVLRGLRHFRVQHHQLQEHRPGRECHAHGAFLSPLLRRDGPVLAVVPVHGATRTHPQRRCVEGGHCLVPRSLHDAAILSVRHYEDDRHRRIHHEYAEPYHDACDIGPRHSGEDYLERRGGHRVQPRGRPDPHLQLRPGPIPPPSGASWGCS